jgi:hypothetical protein
MTLKQKALAHYDRMIEWAEKQPKRVRVDEFSMFSDIGEGWDSDNCPYCDAHNAMCFGCEMNPLKTKATTKIYGSMFCCGALWSEMNESSTWGTWVKRARKVREYIEKHG